MDSSANVDTCQEINSSAAPGGRGQLVRSRMWESKPLVFYFIRHVGV